MCVWGGLSLQKIISTWVFTTFCYEIIWSSLNLVNNEVVEGCSYDQHCIHGTIGGAGLQSPHFILKLTIKQKTKLSQSITMLSSHIICLKPLLTLIFKIRTSFCIPHKKIKKIKKTLAYKIFLSVLSAEKVILENKYNTWKAKRKQKTLASKTFL